MFAPGQMAVLAVDLVPKTSAPSSSNSARRWAMPILVGTDEGEVEGIKNSTTHQPRCSARATETNSPSSTPSSVKRLAGWPTWSCERSFVVVPVPPRLRETVPPPGRSPSRAVATLASGGYPGSPSVLATLHHQSTIALEVVPQVFAHLRRLVLVRPAPAARPRTVTSRSSVARELHCSPVSTAPSSTHQRASSRAPRTAP